MTSYSTLIQPDASHRSSSSCSLPVWSSLQRFVFAASFSSSTNIQSGQGSSFSVPSLPLSSPQHLPSQASSGTTIAAGTAGSSTTTSRSRTANYNPSGPGPVSMVGWSSTSAFSLHPRCLCFRKSQSWSWPRGLLSRRSPTSRRSGRKWSGVPVSMHHKNKNKDVHIRHMLVIQHWSGSGQ